MYYSSEAAVWPIWPAWDLMVADLCSGALVCPVAVRVELSVGVVSCCLVTVGDVVAVCAGDSVGAAFMSWGKAEPEASEEGCEEEASTYSS